MKTRCGIVMLLVALAALLFASLPAAAPASVTLNSYEQQLVKCVNQERTSRGLAKLRVNAKLVDAARAHSADMGEQQYFDARLAERRDVRASASSTSATSARATRPGRPARTSPGAAGLYSSPVAIVDAWMESSDPPRRDPQQETSAISASAP